MDAPAITVLGKEYPVKEFVVRQTIFAQPRVKKIGTLRFGDYSEEQLQAIFDLLFITMPASDPKLSRATFDDLPIPLHEATIALPTILRRLGYDWVTKDAGAPPLDPAATTQPTGTA